MKWKIGAGILILAAFAIMVPSICASAAEEAGIYTEDGSAQENPDEVIENNENGIPDKCLYHCILEHLGKEEGDTFTKQEAERILLLSVEPYGTYHIETFKGIGCCKNLDTLLVRDSSFERMEGMEELPKLRAFTAERTKLRDLTSLSSLTGLEYMEVSEGELKSLAGIEGMTKLEKLYAWDNQLTSLAGIENLTALKDLDVSGNRLDSLAGIEGLTELEVLWAADNRLTGLKELSRLTKLRDISVGSNRIESLEGIEDLHSLTEINVAINKITHADEIEGLKDLELIYMHYNELEELPDLRQHTKISYRNCSFGYNRLTLTEKELKEKLPARFFKGGAKKQGYLKDLMSHQNVKYTFKLTNPASKGKIRRGTTAISGRTIKNSYVDIRVKKGKYWNTVKTVRADGKGRFKFEKLNLKKAEKVTFNVSLYSEEFKQPKSVWMDIPEYTVK